MATPLQDPDFGPPLKQMRKGTRSCLECRRRKIRCVYSKNVRPCDGCASRATQCTSQEYGLVRDQSLKKRKNVHDRVGELEGMISQVLDRLDSRRGSTLSESELGAAEALKSLQAELLPVRVNSRDANSSSRSSSPTQSLPDESFRPSHRFDEAPMLGLFDNDVLRREDLEPVVTPRDDSQAPNPKKARVLKALKALMPSPDDLTLILKESQTFDIQNPWSMVRQSFPDYLGVKLDAFEINEVDMLREFIQKSLSSDSVASVAKIVLCLAISVQQLPAKFDFSKTNLPASVEELQRHYVNCIETLLASDEGFVGTFDGIECLLMLSKLVIEMGQPRKAWLTLRRAISFAHLLGFHRRPKNATVEETLRQKNLWLQIWQGDRFLSLLLGLPYTISEKLFDKKHLELDGPLATINTPFMLKLSIIAGHVIDRNQDQSGMTFSATLKLDQEMEDLKNSMSMSWWETSPETLDPLEASYDMLSAKYSYNTTRILVHLPYLQKSYLDRRYEFSRLAAIDSSRDLIRLYRILRDTKRPMTVPCHTVDFIAFTAAVVLFLNYLASLEFTFCSTHEETQLDTQLCSDVTADLKRVSEEFNSSVARQAVRTLQDFQKALTSCEEMDEDAYEGVIPYFGKFRVVPGKIFEQSMRMKQCAGVIQSNDQLNTPPESIAQSIGNNNSVNQPVSIDYFQPLGTDPFLGQEDGEHWTSMLSTGLHDDWSWFLNGTNIG
ncbi:MAG: hypothetical protein MMC33_000993 [Icmadophila ericetorum]|nr:hypothetical protein [Icmadophila ericetorum]